MRHVCLLFAITAIAGSVAQAQPVPPSNPDTVPAVAVPAIGEDAVVDTDLGHFVIRLDPKLAPKHVKLFKQTAGKHGYDGTTFHRIIPNGIIQGGDPLSKDPRKAKLYGTGGLGLLKAEITDTPLARGTVAAVRRPRDMDSAGTQFFVCLADQPALKGQYTVFGTVVQGMDVVDAIGRTPVVGDTPTRRITMRTVRVQAAASPAQP
jgi:peptidyl-prolyl cis-trans isomerase B (cyclophilin B)